MSEYIHAGDGEDGEDEYEDNGDFNQAIEYDDNDDYGNDDINSKIILMIMTYY